jgi:hypothetical protein
MAGIKLTGDWKRLRAALDGGKVEKRLQDEVGKATAINAALVAKAMRDTIRGVVPPALDPLTIAIKKSSKPLVDRGELWKAIVGVKLTWKKAEVGVLRGTMRSKGGDMVNLGRALHDGATVKVTPKMRALFAQLADASERRDPSGLRGRALALYKRNPKVKWKPLKPTTTSIKIPGRPWIQLTMERAELIDKIRENWNNAVAAALVP